MSARYRSRHFQRKGGCIRSRGALKGVGMSEYPILTPRLGYAEQDPEQWWRSTKAAVREALEKAGHPDILGIGFSGQMHGLVLLDKNKNLVRPAIIWADQRSADLLLELKDRFGLSLLAQCGTAPVTGFLVASLYWLQKFEAETLDRAATFLMPKDFLQFKLTGELGTDESDASGSGIFNVSRRCGQTMLSNGWGFRGHSFQKYTPLRMSSAC